MRRIMIVGGPGSGKTTVARALGKALGLPVHHLDRIVWKPEWRAVPSADWQADLRKIFARGGYVLEGSYPGSYPMRLADCDTLICLDLGIALRFVRVLRRLLDRGRHSRPDLPDGATETDPQHLRPFLRHFWLSHHTLRACQADLMQSAPKGVTVLRLTSRAEVAAFLKQYGADRFDLMK